MTSGRRGDLAFIAVMVCIGVGIGVVDTFSVVDEARRSGHPIPIWKPATWEGTSILVLSLMGPLVTVLTRRVWPLSRPRWRVALIHLGGMAAFGAVHMTVAGLLRWAIYAAVGDRYDKFSMLSDFVYEMRKDALIYVAIVIAYVVWRLYVSASAPALSPAGEGGRDSIEVRDGARRHFVPLAEVAFIEAAGNYVELHRGQTPILHRAPLATMERQLQGQGFVRIHRSRIVQRAQIAQVESKPSGDYVVRLADGRELAGSRRYRRPLLEP